MIYLEPIGGLANRIRVISNGIWLKRKLNTTLFVIWNENNELNCPFDYLFEPIADFSIIKKKDKFNFVTRSNQLTLRQAVKAKLKNIWAGADYCLMDEDFPETDVCAIAQKHRRLYIKTCQRFSDSLAEFKLFEPIQILQHRIDSFFINLNKHTLIGVQIRRTDNFISIANSPVEAFVKRMRDLLSAHENILFFLSTDDRAIEKEIEDMLGEKVIHAEKKLSRQTITGIQDALIDMFILSKTKRILGSYWSSFSEVAAWIGESELEVIVKS